MKTNSTTIRKVLACALLALSILPATAQTELIINGGVESGSSPWSLSGGVSVSANGGFARSGSHFLYLGGANNENDAAYQTITIPANASTATLSFYYNINSLEGNTTAFDTFSATIRNTSGSILATVGNWSNINQDGGPGNPYYHQQTFNLLPFAGQTIRIYFSSISDSSQVTNFRVDDVSVLVTTVASCPYALNSSSENPGSSSGSGSFTVTTGSSCTWSAVSDNTSWLHTSSGSTGSGTVNYNYDANTSPNPRTGHIAVGGQTFTVTQMGSTICSYSLSSYSASPGSGASSGSFSVYAGSGCGWFAMSDATSWLHTSSSGSANGTVNYTYDLNPNTSQRTGHITAGGQTFTVTQSGSTGLSPFLAFPIAGYTAYNNRLVTAVFDHYSGGVLTHQVTSGARDNITEAFNGEHAEKTFGDDGSGGYTKDFQRTPVTLDGIYKYTGTAAQYLQYDGHRGIDYGVAQGTAVFAAAGGMVAFAGWENDLDHSQGFGLYVRLQHSNGYRTYYGHLSSISVSVGATITEGDQIGLSGMTGHATGPHLHFEVRDQASASVDPYGYRGNDVLWKTTVACLFSLNPPSASSASGSGLGSFDVTTSSGCTWAAISDDPSWLHISSGTTTGSGTVNYTYDPNPNASPRIGHITAGGQTFTVTQQAGSGSTTRQGVDYSFDRPSPTGLKAAGYDFVVRYVAPQPNSKNITLSEAQSLQSAGIDIIIVFESYSHRILEGYSAGFADANTAVSVATAAGAPQNFFCYFACDFDAQASDQVAINAYLDGAASALGGVNRVGFYGGSGAIGRILDAGKATKAWQTSNFPGTLDPRISLYQYAHNVTIAGGSCDQNHGYGSDLGQWSAPTPTVAIVLASSPSGRSVVVDNTTSYTTPVALNWTVNSTHTIAATAPDLSTDGHTKYAFSSWSDSGAQSHAVTTPGSATTYTASFSTQYLLDTTASPLASGTFTLNPASAGNWYNPGQTVSVTATAGSGNRFSSWSGVDNSSGNTASVAMNSYRNVTANFTATPVNYMITTVAAPTAGGTTSGDGSFPSGNSQTVTATAKTGYSFANWTEGGTVIPGAPASYTFTVTGNRTLTANFTVHPDNYMITTAAAPTAGGNTSGDGSFFIGSSRTVTATAKSGYTFANWTEGGTVIPDAPASYTFIVTGNRTLTANFAPVQPHGTLQFAQANYPVNENVASGTVTLMVTRTGGSSGAVGVSYATADGTGTNPALAPGDYTAKSGTLSWADGDTVAKPIVVTIIDDQIPETTETFTVTLSSQTGGATLGTPSTATVTITDDDPVPPGGLNFTAGTVNGSQNSQVLVPITVTGFSSIATMQFSMHWNPAVAQFVAVEQLGLGGLAAGNFGVVQSANGTLTLSWDDPNALGVTLVDGTTIFALRFNLVGNPGSSSGVGFDGTPTVVEVRNSQSQVTPTFSGGQMSVVSTVSINGIVSYFGSGAAVPNVTLSVTGGTDRTVTTDASGAYAFTLAAGGTYTLTPSRSSESPPAQGVTTADILAIRKHILGVPPALSATAALAADANGSTSVTTADILDIRKFILGITTSLPTGLWKFQAASTTFNNLAANVTANFTAIKVGDANGSWTPSASLTAQALRPMIHTPQAAAVTPTVAFQASNETATPGGTTKVSISVGGFTNVTTAQFSLAWDANVLRFVSDGDFNLSGLAAANFNVAQAPSGRLSVSWDDPTALGVTLANGTVIFTLTFNVIGGAGTTGILFTNTPTAVEATVSGGAAMFTSQNGIISIVSSDAVSPALSIGVPSDGMVTSGISLLVSGTAADAGRGDSGISLVTVNGVAATGGTASGSGVATWSLAITLTNGTNPLQVIATDGAGNATNKTFIVIVDTNAPVVAVTNFANGQTVNNNSVTLRGTASDGGFGDQGIVSVTVNGTRATGDTVTGAGTATWSFAFALVNGSNPFQIVATDGAGNKATNQFSLTFTPNSAPQFTGPAVMPAAPICEGTNVTIAVTLTSGTAPVSYQWYRGTVNTDLSNPVANGGNISGATSAQLQFANIQSNQSGGYFVVVTNIAGVVPSGVVTVAVVVPPVITQQPVGSTHNPGESVTFAVVATGSSLAYQWQKNGGSIPGATSAMLPLAHITTNDAGTYRVVITNACGITNSADAVLSVNGPPFLTTSLTNQINCVGSNIAFVVSASGTGPLMYQWYFNNSALVGETNATLVLSNVQTNQEGGYSLIVTNVAGSFTNSATLTVNFAPYITQPPAGLTVTQGQANVSFTVAASGKPIPTYQWRKDGVNIPNAISASYTIASAAATSAGNYDVMVSNSCGTTNSVAVPLVVNGPVTLTTLPRTQTANKGATVTFSVRAAGTPPFGYQWRFKGVNIPDATNADYTITNVQLTNAGDYDVVVTNIVNSVTSTPVAVLTVLEGITITRQPASQTVLPGTSVTFAVAATGTAPLTYQWKKNGSAIPGATGASYTINSASTADVAVYSVVVSNIVGPVPSNDATLAVVLRQVKVGDVQVTGAAVGSAVSVPITLVGDGTEHKVSLSVAFDPAVVTYSSSVPVGPTGLSRPVIAAVAGATVTVNNPGGGQPLGVTVEMPPGQTFPAGASEVARLVFAAASASQVACALVQGDLPVVMRQVQDTNGAVLPSEFANGSVTLKTPVSPVVADATGLLGETVAVSTPPGGGGGGFVRVLVYDLGVDRLGNAIRLLNAAGTTAAGIPYVLIPTPTPGTAVNLTLEYYVSDRTTVPTPRLVVETTPAGLPAVAGDAMALEAAGRRGFVNGDNGGFYLNFRTEAGRTYYVQYRDDVAGAWLTSFPAVPGNGGYVQWIDNGPPRTSSPPTGGMRFYRVIRVQ